MVVLLQVFIWLKSGNTYFSSLSVWAKGWGLGIFKTSIRALPGFHTASLYYLSTVLLRGPGGSDQQSLVLKNLSQPLHERSDLL